MKLISSLFFGFMLILPLDFLIFIGFKKHYFDFYKIDLYFNIYFFDNQPFLYLLLISLIFGFLLLYTPLRKFLQLLYILALIASFATLFKPIGKPLGDMVFKKNGVNCTLGKQKFQADLLYKGRKDYFLKREGIKHTIKIAIDELKIE